jgi:deoxyribodipyrimidine photo-lyase
MFWGFMKTILHWFKHDLRIHDMPGFACINPQDCLLPVYIFDPRHRVKLEYGFPKMSDHRLAFLEQSVLTLKEKLRSLNSDLLILEGKPEELLPILTKQFNVHAIHTEKEIAHEELQVVCNVRNSTSIPVIEFESRTMFTESELPWNLEQLPSVFTEFRKGIEKHIGLNHSILAEHLLPEMPMSLDGIDVKHLWNGPYLQHIPIHPKSAIRAIGGEDEGLKRLHEYTYGMHGIATYKETRNGLIGDAYSSKFSPWLALGSLSAKNILKTVNDYEQEFGANDSTYWMKFELLWRDFFQWTVKKHGNVCFKAGGIRGVDKRKTNDPDTFDAWRFGETEDAFVNANMKELYLTGFMSNRGRQNVASYLVHDLNQDWRVGAAWFESRLIDYDVASNWGNWMYIAGVGNDPRQDRVFNTKRQADMYDPNGEYQKLWLHEYMAKNDS